MHLFSDSKVVLIYSPRAVTVIIYFHITSYSVNTNDFVSSL